MIKCYYINLIKATERNLDLIENFSKFNEKEWEIERFNAIGIAQIELDKVPGILTPPEKGCFTSHRELINSLKNLDNHIFIMEDDVQFGKNTQNLITQGMSILPDSWDILYTDICIPNPAQMFDFFKISEELREKKLIGLHNLSKTPFAGASAYIINKNSIKKISELLNTPKELNTPIDIFIAAQIHAGNLNAFTVLPFATTVSKSSNSSQIQNFNDQNADQVWNCYRRLIWNDRDMLACEQEIVELNEFFQNKSSEIFGNLIACLASEKIRIKKQ